MSDMPEKIYAYAGFIVGHSIERKIWYTENEKASVVNYIEEDSKKYVRADLVRELCLLIEKAYAENREIYDEVNALLKLAEGE